MAKRQNQGKHLPPERVGRAKLTAEESLKRVREFKNRKDHFITNVRKGSERRAAGPGLN
jgi:hypothetical protein